MYVPKVENKSSSNDINKKKRVPLDCFFSFFLFLIGAFSFQLPMKRYLYITS